MRIVKKRNVEEYSIAIDGFTTKESAIAASKDLLSFSSGRPTEPGIYLLKACEDIFTLAKVELDGSIELMEGEYIETITKFIKLKRLPK